jgi:hypothetical protein
MRLVGVIYQKASGRVAILTTVLFVVFKATVLPWIAQWTTDVIGVSESIDTGFDFRLDHIYYLADRYGEEGRRFYIWMRWTFDVVFPLVYTGFLVATTAYLARRSRCRVQEKILLVALAAMTFDFLENTFATIVMGIYPRRIDSLVYLLMTASILKWATLGLAFMILAWMLLRWMVAKKRGLMDP